MEKLGISMGLLVSQLVNFGLLLALLYVLLYRPILNMMRQRQERIARSMADADAARESAVRAQQEYDRRIIEGQRQAQEIIAHSTQTAEQGANEIRAEAMRQREEILQKARQEAEAEKQRILAEVQSQIANLSMLATERVLGQTVAVDAGLQRKLIDQFLAELGDGGKARPGSSTAVRDAGR